MITFLESLSSPYPWSIKEIDPYHERIRFAAEQDYVTVLLVKDVVGDMDLINVSFSVGHEQGVTGKGDQYRIFATVMEILRSRMQVLKPDLITFISDKEERSRISLYNRMVKKFIPSNYEVLTSTSQMDSPEQARYLDQHLKDVHDADFHHTVLIKKEHLK